MGLDSARRHVIETDIPARLDALPWGRFHTLVVTALGVTWILDGLEVTLAGALAGAALGAVGAVVLLAPGLLPEDLGWRVAFGLGAVLGLVILYLRRFLPESPRWLMVHGRVREAEAVVAQIEGRVAVGAASAATVAAKAAPTTNYWTLRLHLRDRPIGFVDLARTLFRTYPQRATLGLVLMGTAIGGIAGPVVFGTLIGTGERELIAAGYAFGATLMVAAGAVAWRLGVKAERTSLERVAAPICSNP